jgi:hypothetical protein
MTRPREHKTNQEKTRQRQEQENTRQDKTRHGNTRHDKKQDNRRVMHESLFLYTLPFSCLASFFDKTPLPQFCQKRTSYDVLPRFVKNEKRNQKRKRLMKYTVSVSKQDHNNKLSRSICFIF